MNFYEVLDQVVALLRQRSRVTYRALKLQFKLDDDILEGLKDELIKAQRTAVDEDGEVLVWAGDTAPTTALPQGRAPHSYTPQHLADKILTSRRTLEGERKQVTVLFADIKDSTELIRGLDPEAAQQLLDPAIHRMMDAVHRFEGTVNQVLGDGIMALFGAPIAHEDHAARACYAALHMQTAMQDYTEQVRREFGIEMHIRVGLNSGEVVVRAIGNDLHMEYSAVGETTHLAARMEQLARPGSIRLPVATLALVEGLVRVNALGSVPVKGLTEPVQVYELLGASAMRRRLQAASARGLTRFVGRDTEIEALRQAAQRAAAGHGQIVAVVGEAGVGKSRLTYECVQTYHDDTWRVLESASASYGKATPYFPFIALLKHYVYIEDADDARARRAKVTGHLLTLDESLQDAIPALLYLLDALPENSPFAQLDPTLRRQRIVESLKRLLLRESQVQPLFLIFEDLHWIDSETQALLDSLIESVPTARVLLLVNYRPEYQHAWGSKTYYTQLRLDALPPLSAEAFLQALLGNHASLASLKQLLIERTQGNPFFLEESVHTLVETQVLTGTPGAYRLAQDVPTIQVPATVQAMLAARIDRLPAEAKRLLHTAAVIGTEVSLPLLQSIAELSDDVLFGSLAHLQAAEFLYETRLFPEREYTFKHALMHDVAYGSLLHERRRALHAQIVEALQRLYADRLTEQVERLAYHAWRGEVWDKAVTYYRQAGSKAQAHSAHREAAACWEQALSAMRHLPESRELQQQAIDLRIDLFDAFMPLGQHRRNLQCLHEAEALALALDDQRRLGWALIGIALCLGLLGDTAQATQRGQQVLAIGVALEDEALQIAANTRLGQIYYMMSEYALAMQHLRHNIRPLEGARRPEQVRYLYARIWFALCLKELGAFDEGLRIAEEALRLSEAIDNPFCLSGACYAVGDLCLYQGRPQQAVPLLERALTLCQTAHIWVWFPATATALGTAYALTDRFTDALPLVERVIKQFRGHGPRSAMHVVRASQAYLLLGRAQEVSNVLQRALETTQAHKARGWEAYAQWLCGDIAMRRDPPECTVAETHYQHALALTQTLDMRPLQAHCHRSRGLLYGQMGHHQPARAELSAAIDLYRTMQMTFWLSPTEAALAQLDRR